MFYAGSLPSTGAAAQNNQQDGPWCGILPAVRPTAGSPALNNAWRRSEVRAGFVISPINRLRHLLLQPSRTTIAVITTTVATVKASRNLDRCRLIAEADVRSDVSLWRRCANCCREQLRQACGK